MSKKKELKNKSTLFKRKPEIDDEHVESSPGKDNTDAAQLNQSTPNPISLPHAQSRKKRKRRDRVTFYISHELKSKLENTYAAIRKIADDRNLDYKVTQSDVIEICIDIALSGVDVTELDSADITERVIDFVNQ